MSGLNKEQHQAVYTDADKILCLAGAGTGKTFSMISRISRLVSEGVDPSSILVLTFTNAAAFEMKERYKKTHVKQQLPEFRTFHSFCYSLMATDMNVRKAMGYFKLPKVADQGAIDRIDKTVRMSCKVRLPDAKMKPDAVRTDAEEFEYSLYKKAWARAMKAENLITFDRLCYGICDLFVNNHECTKPYLTRYRYIFVDEFQDTDARQYDFVSSFKDAKLFVVGDALQAIYGFRGADSSIIKGLASDESWTVIKLYQNYRSTEEICNYANRISTYADPTYRIEISSSRSGPDVDVIEEANCDFKNAVDEDHATIVTQMLPKCEGTSAVLCRTNAEVEYMINRVTSAGIPCRTGKRNVDALHILKSAYDDEYLLDWLATFLNAEKYAEYIRLSHQDDGQKYGPCKFLEDFGIIRAVALRADKVAKIRKILKTDDLPFTKCVDILNCLEMESVLVSTNASTGKEIVDYLIAEITEDNSSDIYVGTIHSSKGLEYDNVFLMGVGDACFKLNGEANQNLYYVGVTRAKNNLYVFTE